MTENQNLSKTALYEKHVALEATMADVAGWSMPLSYRSVLDEVGEVRSRAGIFDMTHIARIRIRGDGTLSLLERVCTHDVAHQEDDTAAATLLCNDRGGIIDVCHLLRLEDCWLLLASPINRAKVLEYLQPLAGQFGAKVDDQTQKGTMVSLCGPAAAAALDKVLPEMVSTLGAGAAKSGSMMMARYIVARVNFTGLWELLVILPSMFASQAWRFITEKAGKSVIRPAGLAARDVLRIEAGLPIYGHEVNETIDPFTAGLGGLVAMDHDFVGSAALKELSGKSPARKQVGIVLEEIPEASTLNLAADISEPAKQPAGIFIPRQGAIVSRPDGSEAGTVTSGTYSPALGRIVAMAYVSADVASPESQIFIVQDGTNHAGKVVSLPFVHVGQ